MSHETPETPTDTTPAATPPAQPPTAPAPQRRPNPFAQVAMEHAAEMAARRRRGGFVPEPEESSSWADIPNDRED